MHSPNNANLSNSLESPIYEYKAMKEMQNHNQEPFVNKASPYHNFWIQYQHNQICENLNSKQIAWLHSCIHSY